MVFGVSPGMRTRAVSGFVLLAVVMLSGCAGGDGDVVAGEPADAAPPRVDATAPFSLWLSADRVPPGPVEVVAVLVNEGGGDATFGVGATVDRWEDGAWVAHRQVVMCMDHWHCTARMEGAGGELEMPALGLSAAVGRPGPVERFTTEGLDVGWYRISQEANEGVVAAGILEVAEGAPAPAPLVAVDEPAISVQPPLVAPDGSPVTLQPLIPPVAGSQRIEDVEAGVEGLSESAAVERWEAGSWVPVAEIGFEPAPAPPFFSREAALPALPVGEYRLVRAGPDGAHVGHFWVADTAGTAEVDDEDRPSPSEVAAPGSRAVVTLWHCGIEPLDHDGRTWEVPLGQQPFDATNAPEKFLGTGTVAPDGPGALLYTDDSGIELRFEPEDTEPDPPCA